jgi:hypothetical protein
MTPESRNIPEVEFIMLPYAGQTVFVYQLSWFQQPGVSYLPSLGHKGITDRIESDRIRGTNRQTQTSRCLATIGGHTDSKVNA